jgi:hypothetical protein
VLNSPLASVLFILAEWEKIPWLAVISASDLPSFAEQRRIVAKVEQLMALVDALETQFVASRTAATGLMEALVAELSAKG